MGDGKADFGTVIHEWQQETGGDPRILHREVMRDLEEQAGYSRGIKEIARITAQDLIDGLDAPEAPPAPPAPTQEPLGFPPGIAGEIARWLAEGNHVENDPASVCSVLAFAAAMGGRTWYNASPQSPNGDGLNVYLCLLSASAGGKEWMWGGLRKLISIAGLEEESGLIMGQRPASGTALGEMLDDAPCRIVPLPEVGKWLQRVLSHKANGAEIALQTEILSLYSASGPGSVHAGSAKAGKQGTKALREPSLTILGETTPSSLYAALSDEAAASGLVSRLLFLGGQERGEDRYSASCRPLGFNFSEFVKAMGEHWTTERPERRAIRWSEEARAVDREEFDCWAGEKRGAGEHVALVVSRQRQNAPRIAALLALWDNPQEPLVSADAVRWAWRAVRHGSNTILAAYESGEIQSGEAETLEETAMRFAVERMNEDRHVSRMTLQTNLKRKPGFREEFQGGSSRYSNTLKSVLAGLVEDGRLALVPRDQTKLDAPGKVYLVIR